MDCFFIALKCRVCEIFRTFRFSRFLHVSFFKSSTFRFAGLSRTSYGEIRKFIFAALVAKTDIDLIALDKGEITPRKVVDQLIDKMEQYANFGFSYIYEKMEEDPNHFFRETAFLHLFLSFLDEKKEEDIQLEEL